MNITERIVSIKRHTIGYVVGNVEYTRREAIKEARRGTIQNARVVKNTRYGTHLVGTGNTVLYDLPERFPRSRRMASLRSR